MLLVFLMPKTEQFEILIFISCSFYLIILSKNNAIIIEQNKTKYPIANLKRKIKTFTLCQGILVYLTFL